MFELALALGKTVEDIENNMTSNELTEWIAFDNLSPISHDRGDVGHAVVAQTIASVNNPRGRYRLKDFMPLLSRRTTSQSQSEMKAQFDAFARTTDA